MGSYENMEEGDEDEEQHTQPTQQTQEATQPTNSIVDYQNFPDVLCLLMPASPTAKELVIKMFWEGKYELLACTDSNDRLFPKSSLPLSPAPKDEFEMASMLGVDLDKLSIALRITADTPRDKAKGFAFGRHATSDVRLGTATQLSNHHFQIRVNEESHLLMLYDTSSNGTFIDDERVCAERNSNKDLPRMKVISNGSSIKVSPDKPNEIHFRVRLFEENITGADTDTDDASVGGPPRPRVNRVTTLKYVGPYNKYECIRLVGQGSFAIVYEGVERMTGETVAVKQIKKRGTQRSAIQKEVDIMAKLNHENIVKFHEHFDDDEYLSIILEFVRGGDLRDYRKTHGVLPEFLVKSVASQVLSAVGYLHQQGVTHRDIKPENILVSSKNPLVVKLTDFGLAKAIANDQSMLKTFCGTMLYLAPEVFPEHYLKAANVGEKRKRVKDDDPKSKKKGSYTQSIDIWAIGCVLYFLLTDRHPFDCGDDRELTLSRICNAQYDIQLLEQHSSSAFECTDFISRMLQVEPRFRISDTEALVHPYLGGEASPSPSSLADENLSQSAQELRMDDSPLGSEHATLRPRDFRRNWEEGSQAVNPLFNASCDNDGNLTSRAASVCGNEGEDDEELHDAADGPHELNSQNFKVLFSSMASQQLPGGDGSPMDSQQNYSPMDSQPEHLPSGTILGNLDMLASQLGAPPDSQSDSQYSDGHTPMDSQQDLGHLASPNGGSPMDSQQEPSQFGQQIVGSPSQLGSKQASQQSQEANSDAHSVAVFASSSVLGSISSHYANLGSSLSISDLRCSNNSSFHGGTAFSAAVSAFPSDADIHPFRNPKHIKSSQISELEFDARTENIKDESASKFNKSIKRSNRRELTSKPVGNQGQLGSKAMIPVGGLGQSIGPPGSNDFRLPLKPWGRLGPLANSIEKISYRCAGTDILFGRNPKCQVQLKCGHISKKHLLIKVDNPSEPTAGSRSPVEVNGNLKFYVYVEKGAKGTRTCWVNDVEVEEKRFCRIFDGDEIVLWRDKKEFIGFTCELFRGKYTHRPRELPKSTLIYREETEAPLNAAFQSNDSSRSGSDVSTGSAPGGEGLKNAQSTTSSELQSSEKKTTEPMNRNNDTKHSVRGGVSAIPKAVAPRRSWTGSAQSSSSVTRSTGRHYPHSRGNSRNQSPAVLKMKFASTRTRPKKPRTDKTNDGNRAYSQLSTPPPTANSESNSYPLRRTEPIVKLEDRDDLFNEKRMKR